MHVFADRALAVRLERCAAEDVRGFVESAQLLFPDAGSRLLEVAGGMAGFVDAGSPANGAIGLGLESEVTHDHIEAVERFFEECGEEPIVAVCPLAHPSLPSVLGQRGWTIGALENVLVREIDVGDAIDGPASGVVVSEALTEAERDTWAVMTARGFSAPEPPTRPELRLARAASARAGARFLFGSLDGGLAGTGQLEIDGDLAWLSGDATMPPFRRRGVQGSLQRARLQIARDAGCTLAVTESIPGSASQRNMERLGFRVAYTRVDARRPRPVSESGGKVQAR